MIERLIGMLCALSLLSGSALAQALTPFPIVYLSRAGDPAYRNTGSYAGLVLHERRPPLDGARLALGESRVLGRAVGITFELVEAEMSEGQSATEVIRSIRAGSAAEVFILDLPVDEVAAAGHDLAADDGLVLFNVRHGDAALRGEACSPILFHTYPSDAMLTDGLAQFLQSRGWTEILMLTGPNPADMAKAQSFRASAQKFGLAVEDERRFVLGNDPRSREDNNIRLLTGGADYDVIFIADEVGEFSRYVPFSAISPRPVMGAEGLAASAWHWAWERHGAPQLNQRFSRLADRKMSDSDWAAWAAVRSTVEAVIRTGSKDGRQIREYLRQPNLNLDLYKGIPGSFRAWDNQLRQPILLGTHNAVVAQAPVEGFLHQNTVLDSLGADAPETTCRM